MSAKTLDATISATYSLTPRVRQILLHVDDHVFSHQPGQHVSVRYEPDGESPTYRPYSPVSGPGTNRVALAVKRYDAGTLSVWLHERAVGDTVTLTPPSGNLHLRDEDRDALFLATGTGLTPMLGMLHQYTEKGGGRSALVFGERSEEDLMYRATLDRLAAGRDDVTVRYVLSEPSSRWTGRTGYVQEHLDDVLSHLEDPHVYACGVPEMVVATVDRLQDKGLSTDQILTEGWEDGAVEDSSDA